MKLVPVGGVVKRTETWHQRKRLNRGGGWSDEQRKRFKVWEAQERSERWTVLEHVEPGQPYNATTYPIYKLQRLGEVGGVAWSLPYDWEEA